LELTYQKSVMILHRRHLTYKRLDPSYRHSRQACVAASSQVLEYQTEMHRATQPDAQLHNQRWSTSSIAMHDFLLAGMIACLDLYESHRETGNMPMSATAMEAQAKKYDALKTSQEIWQTQRNMFTDAKRASSVLAVMLSKIPRPGSPAPRTAEGPFNSSTDVSQSLAQMTFNSTNAELPRGNGPFSGTVSFEHATYPSMDFDSSATQDFPSQDFLDTVFPESEMLDWSILDQYIQEGASPLRSFTF